MSLTPQAPKKPDDFAFALLCFPFNTLDAIGRRIASAFTGTPKQQQKDQQQEPFAQPGPDITARQRYRVADRVFQTEIDGRKVSFFQYHSDQVIRISCREIRHLKPIDFTPAIADRDRLPYDIDGAIQWTRHNGLEPGTAQSVAGKEVRRTNTAPVLSQEKKVGPIKVKPASPAAHSEPFNIVPAIGNKSVPFTGNIVSFGTTQIKSGDRKPYTTYEMTLRSETGSYEKQFIGEHLADLVTELSLYEGQLVRLQLLGKHHFEVEVNGKMEARSRNHFAIDTL